MYQNQNTEFSFEEFIIMLAKWSSQHPKIYFTILENAFFKFYWFGMTDKQIVEDLDENRAKYKHYYNSNYYIRGGFRPNIMEKLSKLIGVPVNRSNFRQVCKKIWLENNQTDYESRVNA